MSGPARAGLFIYAKDLPRLADFYESLLGMSRVHGTAELVILRSPDIQLTLHAIPAAIAASIESPRLSWTPSCLKALPAFRTLPERRLRSFHAGVWGCRTSRCNRTRRSSQLRGSDRSAA